MAVLPSLEFRLLAALTRQPLASNAMLAEGLGVSAEAVRKRLVHLREDGVLGGFTAMPAAAVFGRQPQGVGFARPIDLRDLLALDDAVWAATSVDDKCGVMAYTNDPDGFTERAVELAGRPPIQTGALHAASSIPPLGPLEWRVLRAMLLEPRASLRHLSEATGLSYRTVRDRQDGLLRSGAITVDPLLRPSRSGALFFHLWVTLADAEAEAQVRPLFGEHVVINRYAAPPSVYMFCQAPDLGAQAAMVRRVEEHPAVATLHVVLNADHATHVERLLWWIDAELESWARRPTA